VAQPTRLTPGSTYDWEELAREFDCEPNYFSTAGGMISRPQQGALLLITHAGGARENEYGDYWDGDDLVYTGRGKRGHQKRNGQNRDLGDNARTNYVFEPAGSRQLLFLGQAVCVEEWTERDLDVEGEPRFVLRFRLRFQTEKPRAARKAPSSPTSTSAVARKPRPFDPDLAPKQPAPAAATADSEETQALREKAVKGHHELLCALTSWLESKGWDGIEEIPLAVDLWALMPDQKTRVIFEAKTVHALSEGPRVRSAIAQLLEYRFLYGDEKDRLCLVCDQPISGRRVPLLEHLGIAVLWRDDGTFKAGSSASAKLLK
jgi:hypothetical protein